jgi:hypothetical protein
MIMSYKRYILAFLITSAIFATAILISNKLSEDKLAQVKAIEDKMSIDILSLETQFDLLQELSCEQISEDSILSSELSNLANKLSYMEEQRGSDDPEVIRLKRRYSLLQIKDLLLMNKISDKCDITPTVVLYFYSNAGDCSACKRQGYVLTKLGNEYEDLRIYAFDANLDLSVLKTLLSINKVSTELPALVIDKETFTGFQSLEKMYELLPELADTEESGKVSGTPE